MRRLAMALLVVGVLVGASCSDGDDSADDTTSTTEAPSVGSDVDEGADDSTITVLVTNDDGVGAEGIDTLVEALEARDDVEVVVVAPAENQSGSGGRTTDGELEVTDATTASGTEATAVTGFPADSVIWALTDGGIEPDLVISGANEGQNIGPASTISGTVGAARQAAQLGVPALAVSQGFGDPPDFDASVGAAMDWLDENFESVADGSIGTDMITSINAPTCPEGEPQGVVEVPLLPETDQNIIEVDCAGAAEPVDDVTAFVNGWIAVTPLEPTGSVTE